MSTASSASTSKKRQATITQFLGRTLDAEESKSSTSTTTISLALAQNDNRGNSQATTNPVYNGNGKKSRTDDGDFYSDWVIVDYFCGADPCSFNVSFLSRDDIIAFGPIRPVLSDYPSTAFSVKSKTGTTIKHLSFQKCWYENCSWLEYSISQDVITCFVCRVFSGELLNINNWRKITGTDGKLLKHQCSKTHSKNMELWENWKATQKNMELRIDSRFSALKLAQMKEIEERKAKNREVMKRICNSISFLSRNGLAFRGDDESKESLNQGNFLELLKLLALYDERLKEYLMDAPKNATYLSAEIQNELVRLMGLQIQENVLSRIKESRYFSILVDEAQDVSHKEWMSYYFRIISPSGHVEEVFAGLSKVHSTTAENLFEVIKNRLKFWGIDIKKCKGQGYDGASNMSGHITGLRTRIQEVAPEAVYIHCCAHNLNLCLVETAKLKPDTFQNRPITHLFGTVQLLYNFISGSSLRHDVFLDSQKRLYTDNLPCRLKALSDTRWSCRYDSLYVISKTYRAILETLSEISENPRTTSIHQVEAETLLGNIQKFDFLIAFYGMLELMGIIDKLSKFLQKANQDLANAVQLINATKESLSLARNNFDEIYEGCLRWISKSELGVDPSLPDSLLRSRNRSNNAASLALAPKDYYRIHFWIPTVEQFINSFETRFDHGALLCFKGVAALIPKDNLSGINVDDISEFAAMFASEFPDISKLKKELKEFIRFAQHGDQYQDSTCIEDVVTGMIKHDHAKIFPLTFKLYQIALVLPITTASVERSFSSFKYIKNRLRSTMGDERMEHLTLLYIHKAIELDLDAIIDQFKLQGKRRLDL
jgi:hypothetical protein